MSKDKFLEHLGKHPRPVVVDFWAPWCGPCRAIGPTLKKLGDDYTGRVDVWKVNADERSDLLRELRIFGVPTLIAYHKGEEVVRRTGAASSATLAGLFEAALAGVKPAQTGPALADRMLRLAIGSALLVLAMQGGLSGWHMALAALGAIVLFSAVYDRCPIYRMVSARVAELLRRDSKREPSS
jgi:thioredoxin 1